MLMLACQLMSPVAIDERPEAKVFLKIFIKKMTTFSLELLLEDAYEEPHRFIRFS